MAEHDERDEALEAVYTIGVVARMVGVHAQTLRYYERVGVVKPARSRGQMRFYSRRDIERLRQIKTLMDDLGVNLAGVDIILRLTERLAQMDEHVKTLEHMVRQLYAKDAPEERGDTP